MCTLGQGKVYGFVLQLAMAGLIIQAIALLLYAFLLLSGVTNCKHYISHRGRLKTLILTLYRASQYPQKWRMGAGHSSNRYAKAIFSGQPVAGWRILFWTIAASMIFWLWRSAFMPAEYNGGYDGVSAACSFS